MKCPKCGYVSHDYLDACRKCSVDLGAFKAQMQLHVVQAGLVDLCSIIGGAQPSPVTSSEFEMDPSLFNSPMLIEAHEDGFDISLDDDFSFTPSAMSLESLDGFEISNLAALSREPQTPPADTDHPTGPNTGSNTGVEDPPDMGYATVMMDLTNMNDEMPSLDPGNLFDDPIESASHSGELSIGTLGDMLAPPSDAAGSGIELPALPPDEMFIDPDLTSAELRSSILGRTADLDITSMELRRTTRDIEMLKKLEEEAAATEQETAPPEETSSQDSAEHLLISEFAFDQPDETPWSDTGIVMPDVSNQAPDASPDDILSAELVPDTTELALPLLGDDDSTPPHHEDSSTHFDISNTNDWVDIEDNDQQATLTDDAAAAFDPALPGAFPDETDDQDDLNNESGELILPSLDSNFLADDATASPLTGSAVSSSAERFEMPELPEGAGEENRAEMSFDDDDLMDVDGAPLPLEFPSLQTGILPASMPEEAAIVDEQAVQLPVQPAAERDTSAPPEALVFPDLPDQTDAFLTPPEEATMIDEQPPPLPNRHAPADVTTTPADTGFATVELDISHVQQLETPAFPELLEQADTRWATSPEEATIIDELPPSLPSGHTPTDFTIAPADTGFATVELDISHLEQPEAFVFPDLPEQTDARLTLTPEEATIVDEPSPLLPTGHTPIDFNMAPPDTGETTLRLDMDDFVEEFGEEIDPETSAQKSKKPNRDTENESPQ